MGAERAVARLAADTHLGHRRVIAVRRSIIVLSDPCVVAPGTHVVPIHTAPGPMSPLARPPVLAAIDIEPFAPERVECGFHRLVAPAGSFAKKLAQRVVPDDARNDVRLGKVRQPDAHDFLPVTVATDRSHLRAMME